MKPKKLPQLPQTSDASASLMTKRKKRARVTVKIDHPKHGKMEIHSMRASFGEPCVLMDAAGAATHEAPVWIQLAKQGRFLGHSAGPFEMTGKTFEEIVRNFKAHPEHVPIDFEHASESDASSGSIPHTGAPAQGWIIDMKVENGGLYGLVEWGELARDYIQSKKYKYFSPAIRFGAKDRVTGAPIGARMTSGALTNSPFLSGLQQVAAKDTEDPDEVEDLDEDDEDELPALAGDETANTETEMELEKKLKDTEDKLAITSDKFTMADAKAKDLEKTVTAKDAELTMVKTENAALQKWRDERENKDFADEVDAAFATYKDQRKLSDADKAPMLVMLKAAPDAFRSMYPAVDLDKRHLLRVVTGPRSKADAAETTEIPDIITLSDKLRKEEKMGHAEALAEADKRIRAMRKQRSA